MPKRKNKSAKKQLVRVAGYDPEGRRRIVCEAETSDKAMEQSQIDAERYIKEHSEAEPLSSWRLEVE